MNFLERCLSQGSEAVILDIGSGEKRPLLLSFHCAVKALHPKEESTNNCWEDSPCFLERGLL